MIGVQDYSIVNIPFVIKVAINAKESIIGKF